LFEQRHAAKAIRMRVRLLYAAALKLQLLIIEGHTKNTAGCVI